ncbi:phage integrase SAM-like domain-containing protein [Flagellimonas sp.]|uniref:phage integrase SAM-like domain-containing protein n=1 Tax=Flagellimonas sp. TaxID=2058762 RepID=UPI003B5003D5
MATTVTIELRNEPNKVGLFPLALRMTTDRLPKYRRIGVYINKKDWDSDKKIVKSTHPEAERLNNFIIEQLHKTYKLVNISKSKGIASPDFKKKKKAKKKSNFFDHAQKFIEEIEIEEKFSRLATEKANLSYVKRFHKSESLPFESIDVLFLKRLRAFMSRKHSLKEHSILNVFVFIRTVYNRAINEGGAKKKHYPFGRGKNKIQIKFPETRKIGLTKEEIIALESLADLSEGEQHALNVWMYSFNFAGMRVSDVLKERWSNYQNGRLYYKMGKNSKLVSLKVPEKIFSILEFYKKDKRCADDFIFPELKVVDMDNPREAFKKIKTATKRLNRSLKKLAARAGIEKPLTMHIARHSFGHIAGEKIHPKKLQKLYRHSDLKTTLNYQANFIHIDADEALDSVLKF